MNQEKRIKRVGKDKSRLDKHRKFVYNHLDSFDNEEYDVVQKIYRNIAK